MGAFNGGTVDRLPGLSERDVMRAAGVGGRVGGACWRLYLPHHLSLWASPPASYIVALPLLLTHYLLFCARQLSLSVGKIYGGVE